MKQPKDLIALLNLGILFFELESYEDSLMSFEKFYENGGDHEVANKLYNRCIQILN